MSAYRYGDLDALRERARKFLTDWRSKRRRPRKRVVKPRVAAGSTAAKEATDAELDRLAMRLLREREG